MASVVFCIVYPVVQLRKQANSILITSIDGTRLYNGGLHWRHRMRRLISSTRAGSKRSFTVGLPSVRGKLSSKVPTTLSIRGRGPANEGQSALSRGCAFV